MYARRGDDLEFAAAWDASADAGAAPIENDLKWRALARTEELKTIRACESQGVPGDGNKPRRRLSEYGKG